MLERRRIFRQPCDLKGRIYIPKSNTTAMECSIIDITTHGAFLRPAIATEIPTAFDLTIGNSNSARSCRLARQTRDGFGVEFLDPIRAEIEEALIKAAFADELLIDHASGVLMDDSAVNARLLRAVGAMMSIIEQRNSMTWQGSKAA